MTILEEILENNKLLSGNEKELGLYWENKVKIVAKIAVESGLMWYDEAYWKKFPCLVLSLIYHLYSDKESAKPKPVKQNTKFKVGDRVKVNSTTFSKHLFGQTGTVVNELDCHGHVAVMMDFDDRKNACWTFKESAIDKIEVPVAKFKVGDRVKVKGTDNFGIIANIFNMELSGINYEVKLDRFKYSSSFFFESSLIKEEPINAPPKFKVGDQVKINSTTVADNYIGFFAEVVVDSDSYGYVGVKFYDGNDIFYFKESSLDKIKEISIKFKVGDKVRVNKNSLDYKNIGNIGTVQRIDPNGWFNANRTINENLYYIRFPNKNTDDFYPEHSLSSLQLEVGDKVQYINSQNGYIGRKATIIKINEKPNQTYGRWVSVRYDKSKTSGGFFETDLKMCDN